MNPANIFNRETRPIQMEFQSCLLLGCFCKPDIVDHRSDCTFRAVWSWSAMAALASKGALWVQYGISDFFFKQRELFMNSSWRQSRLISLFHVFFIQGLGPNTPTILKNILCFFLQDLYIWTQHNFWLSKPDGLANQKLCYIQLLLNIEKSV